MVPAAFTLSELTNVAKTIGGYSPTTLSTPERRTTIDQYEETTSSDGDRHYTTIRPMPRSQPYISHVDGQVLPNAVLELSSLIARSIEDGGQAFVRSDSSGSNWLSSIQDFDSGTQQMTLEQMYNAHTNIADGASRQSRKSSLIRCLLMLVISKKTGRPSHVSRSISSGEINVSEGRLRRYLAATGRLFIDLINHLAADHGTKAYNACTAIFCRSRRVLTT